MGRSVLTMEGCCLSSSASLSRLLRALERVEPADDSGRPFLWFVGRQSYEEALAFAGLVDHEAPVFPIQVIGVKPRLDDATTSTDEN